MPGKRNAIRPKMKWSYEMNMCLLDCRNRAITLSKSDDAPRKVTGRKVGYMELMHNYFLEAYPGCSILTKQNLRDKIKEAEKCQQSEKTELSTLYETEVNSMARVECDEVADDAKDIDKINYYISQPFNELECKACEKAKDLLDTIQVERGIMSSRDWHTRVKKSPSISDVNSVNKIVAKLLNNIDTIKELCANEFKLLWILNCVVYTAIISWYIVNEIKCKVRNGSNVRKVTKPDWLIKIEGIIFEKRRLISKCVAEIGRLQNNSRMTRKTKRNRKGIGVLLVGDISIYSLTKFVCKLKAQIHRQAQLRRRKISNEKAKEWNNKFHNNQSKVFNDFKQMVENDNENTHPRFKECVKVRKYFEDSDAVLKFWKSLWCKQDVGRPEAEWLVEYASLFESKIPEICDSNLIVTSADITNAIRKKRNWSSPGPDLITNFWLKRLVVIHEPIKSIFSKIINNDRCVVEKWFCCGRTGLLEKPGEWAYDNTRPITCTNNMYKWFTSLLLIFYNRHKQKYSIMQMDQRGAKEKCSGTMENLLIDNMVLQDAHDHKRNLTCSWIDISKAYDSLSHSWIKHMLSVHRFPLKLQNVISKIIDAWNIQLIIPLVDKDVMSDPLTVSNGVLQGDVISPNLYTLSTNPISWEIRRYDGYKISKPISCKITHSLFMDDLKNYTKSFNEHRNLLSDIKEKMSDAGLQWNAKKCKVINIKRGALDTSSDEMVLPDGTKLECLKSEQVYKFLGVPENALHDVENLVNSLKKVITQRSSVIWSSPLSDYNKVMATNVFVYSVMEYFMWSERFNLGDLRELDTSVRDVMNKEHAKYSLQMNASLYLPRSKGGRGLRNFESLYKKTRVKAAMNILSGTDPRIQCVKEVELDRMKKGRSSIVGDAIRYAEQDFGVMLEKIDDGFEVKVDKEGEVKVLTNKLAVKKLLKDKDVENLIKKMRASEWQGVIFKLRYNDETLVGDAFAWLTKWKSCAVDVVNELQSIHVQTIPTLSFQKFRGAANINSTLCRLCSEGNEDVKHILSSCQLFLPTAFKRRHDKCLQFILFNFLVKNDLMERCPPWYTKTQIKPHYENDNIVVYWDIPEYYGNIEEEEDDDKTLRPDGKLILKTSKIIYVLEMSVPWLENRKTKLIEKETKYVEIIQRLKIDHPGFNVKQLTFIIDQLGGYSKDLVVSLETLKFNSSEINGIIYGMQKIVWTEAVAIMRRFKIRTKL